MTVCNHTWRTHGKQPKGLVWKTRGVRRIFVLVFIFLVAFPSCGRTDPSQQRYKDAAETSSHLIESVSDYMIWMNTPDESEGEELLQRKEDGEDDLYSYDFNAEEIELADKRIRKMKDRYAKAFAYMDIYRGEDSKAANLVADFVEAIGPWITGQEEKWDALRVCYDKSEPKEKTSMFSCLSHTALTNEETWNDFDAKILKLADEMEDLFFG